MRHGRRRRLRQQLQDDNGLFESKPVPRWSLHPLAPGAHQDRQIRSEDSGIEKRHRPRILNLLAEQPALALDAGILDPDDPHLVVATDRRRIAAKREGDLASISDLFEELPVDMLRSVADHIVPQRLAHNRGRPP